MMIFVGLFVGWLAFMTFVLALLKTAKSQPDPERDMAKWLDNPERWTHTRTTSTFTIDDDPK